ncbi:MAG: STM3941 family protein [Collinsella sp.]|nr:STM3941 family protein [Collinsella sp.]
MNETTAYRSHDVLEIKNPIVMHLILILMGLCLFTAALLAAFAPLPHAENPLVMRIGMGYLGLPVSCGIILLNIHKILHRRSAIRIDKQGITDNTSLLSSGFTPWDEISEVFLLRLKSDDYLCAVPVDYEAWYSKLSKRQKGLAQANVDAGFAPIRIQFKKVSDRVTSKEGVSFVKKIVPKKVSRIRKPRY